MRDLHPVPIPPLLQLLYQECHLERVLSPEEFAGGFRDIADELHQLTFDAHKAEVRGVPFSKAVQDSFSYPHLARFHVLLPNALRQQLPPSFVDWYRDLLRRPEPPVVEEVRWTVVAMAAADDNERRRSLWRYLLVEGVYLNLLVMRDANVSDTACARMPFTMLHRIAERTVRRWFASGNPVREDVRPYRLMVTAALHEMVSQHEGALHHILRNFQEYLADELEQRRTLEMMLSPLPAEEYVLLRNKYAVFLDEQSLSHRELQRQHSDLLGHLSEDALAQRVSRADRQLRADAVGLSGAASTKARKRRRPTLLNLIHETSHSVKG